MFNIMHKECKQMKDKIYQKENINTPLYNDTLSKFIQSATKKIQVSPLNEMKLPFVSQESNSNISIIKCKLRISRRDY